MQGIRFQWSISMNMQKKVVFPAPASRHPGGLGFTVCFQQPGSADCERGALDAMYSMQTATW